MTKEEKLKKFSWVTIFISIIFIVIYLYCFGCPNKPIDLLKLLGTLSIVSTLTFYLVNNYLWKIKWISSFFGSIPNLNGKWEGIIINTKDGKKQKADIIIEQTWLNINVITEVERGNSTTILSELIKINYSWKLYFVWNASFNGVLFDGTTIVTILNEKTLDGYYFTNSNIDGRKCTSGSFKGKKES